MPAAGLVALRGCPLSPRCLGQGQERGGGTSGCRPGTEAGQGWARVSRVTQPRMRSGCITYELPVCASLSPCVSLLVSDFKKPALPPSRFPLAADVLLQGTDTSVRRAHGCARGSRVPACVPWSLAGTWTLLAASA